MCEKVSQNLLLLYILNKRYYNYVKAFTSQSIIVFKVNMNNLAKSSLTTQLILLLSEIGNHEFVFYGLYSMLTTGTISGSTPFNQMRAQVYTECAKTNYGFTFDVYGCHGRSMIDEDIYTSCARRGYI